MVKGKEGKYIVISEQNACMVMYSWWILVKRGDCLNSARADANIGGIGGIVMKTIWQQIMEQTAIDCYDKAVDAEIMYPLMSRKAFRLYYVAALLGNKDAAFHVAMAFEIGHGVKRSERLAEMWYKISSRFA